MNKKQKVIFFYGGPSAGKSTTAAHVYADLKMRSIDAHLVTETAKDLVWEDDMHRLSFQSIVNGRLMDRIVSARGAAVTVVDTSPLLSCVYCSELRGPWSSVILADLAKFDCLHVFVNRGDRAFSPEGRLGTEADAIVKDTEIEDLLRETGVNYVRVSGPSDLVLIDAILKLLKRSE